MMLSIWQPNLIEAHTLIRDNELEKYFVQFLEDTTNVKGYYIILNKIPSSIVQNLFNKYKLASGKTKLSYL
jgi:hypothetical protein